MGEHQQSTYRSEDTIWLAQDCKFGNVLMIMLKDIFVVGIANDQLGEWLLTEDAKTLTFDAAVAKNCEDSGIAPSVYHVTILNAFLDVVGKAMILETVAEKPFPGCLIEPVL
ncbi:unnamed protein product [Caretta caretta]